MPAEVCDYDGLNDRLSLLQRCGAYSYLEILYPEYYISQDLIEPLKAEYKSYVYEITLTSQKNEAFRMQTVEFNDDQNWITNVPVPSHKIVLN